MSRLNIGIAVIVLTAALSAAGYAAAKAVEAMAVVTVVDMVGSSRRRSWRWAFSWRRPPWRRAFGGGGHFADLRALAPLQDRV